MADNITVVSRDPWIVTLDDFISRQESNALIKTLKGKFEESTTVGAKVDVGEMAKVTELACCFWFLAFYFLFRLLSPLLRLPSPPPPFIVIILHCWHP